MVRIRAFLTSLIVASLAACASGQTDVPPNLVNDAPPMPSTPMVTGTVAPPSDYQLTDAELAYDCRKLTGLMQVRILQVRSYDSSRQASTASRSLQSLTKPIFGGSKEGMDPDGQYQRDVAMLRAYNHRLALKSCKTFDLAAELAATDDRTPMPRYGPPTY
jgi:hypothetical protein